MAQHSWKREDDILVLDLYFRHDKQTPLSDDDPQIEEVSDLIGASAPSVYMRMCNMRHLDGQGGGIDEFTRQTKGVYEEFKLNPSGLRRAADAIRKERRNEGRS